LQLLLFDNSRAVVLLRSDGAQNVFHLHIQRVIPQIGSIQPGGNGVQTLFKIQNHRFGGLRLDDTALIGDCQVTLGIKTGRIGRALDFPTVVAIAFDEGLGLVELRKGAIIAPGGPLGGVLAFGLLQQVVDIRKGIGFDGLQLQPPISLGQVFSKADCRLRVSGLRRSGRLPKCVFNRSICSVQIGGTGLASESAVLDHLRHQCPNDLRGIPRGQQLGPSAGQIRQWIPAGGQRFPGGQQG